MLGAGPAVAVWLAAAAPTAAAPEPVGEPPVGEASQRRYRVDGADAWQLAHRRGFEFYPVIPDRRFILSGARDGALIRLKRCDGLSRACETEAEVAGGELRVRRPVCEGPCTRSHVFALFQGRELAPGWSVIAVELAGPGVEWDSPPRYGSAALAFRVRLTASPGEDARSRMGTLVLEGPEDGRWQDAFASGARPEPGARAFSYSQYDRSIVAANGAGPDGGPGPTTACRG